MSLVRQSRRHSPSGGVIKTLRFGSWGAHDANPASLKHDRLHGHRTTRIRGSSCDGAARITCKFAKSDGSPPDWISLMLRFTRCTIANPQLVVVACLVLADGVLVVSKDVRKRDANN